jgi:hypothetical protein
MRVYGQGRAGYFPVSRFALSAPLHTVAVQQQEATLRDFARRMKRDAESKR